VHKHRSVGLDIRPRLKADSYGGEVLVNKVTWVRTRLSEAPVESHKKSTNGRVLGGFQPARASGCVSAWVVVVCHVALPLSSSPTLSAPETPPNSSLKICVKSSGKTSSASER
jgi:hypothetical protein